MTWYTGDPLYDTLLIVGFAYAALVLVGSFFGTAVPKKLPTKTNAA